MRRRVVVIGAGVSGLAAAHAVARESANVDIVVLEREAEVGGRSTSVRDDGWLVEAGPGGYLDTESEVVRLVREVGLADRQIAAQAAAARRFIYRGGRLHRLGAGLLVPTPGSLLGVSGVIRAMAEPLVAKGAPDQDESILEFCDRRFGERVANRIAHTAMLGIFAGDAARLSLDACFPQLRQMEQEHGSIVRAGLAMRRAGRRDAGGEIDVPSRRLASFQGGLQELPRALAANPRVDVRLGVAVTDLRRAPTAIGAAEIDNGYVIDTTAGQPLHADAVIIATPVQVAAHLFATLAPNVARLLGEVPVPPVVVVGLGFDAVAAARFPIGFGVLVSREDNVRMLGCLWESHIYPGRSPDGCFLARAMFGGRLDPAAGDLDDAEILKLVRENLRTVLGVDDAPIYTQIVRWSAAIPQYEIGHRAIKAAVEVELEQHPGIFLAGDALEGVSFPKTAVSGLRQGRRAARYLGGEGLAA